MKLKRFLRLKRNNLAVLTMLLFLVAGLLIIPAGPTKMEQPVSQSQDLAPNGDVAPIMAGTAISPELGAYFTENLGQLGDDDWRFYAVGQGMAIAFGDGVYAYRVIEDDSQAACLITVRFVGATDVCPQGVGLMAHPTNYLIGDIQERWVLGARSYREIVYDDVWGGIDIRFLLNEGQLKYWIEVPPGEDPARMGFEYLGADHIEIEASSGDLLIQTPSGVIRDSAPVSNQSSGTGITVIPTSYELRGDNIVGLKFAKYQCGLPLLIDPVLRFSTFLGGSSEEWYPAIAIDASGNSYVTGYTDSTDFTMTSGAYNTSNEGQIDAFVVKVNATGSGVVYATYLGGEHVDLGYAIAVDSSGNAYVTGGTDSTDFPTTSGAYDISNAGSYDVFVTKLNSTGSGLVYSTLAGGSSIDTGYGVDLDSSGHAYVSGGTSSSDFPTSTGAIDTSHNGGMDGFVLKLSANGTALNYSTYLGGTAYECANDIVVDAYGRAVTIGQTSDGSFPTTSGAYDTSLNGNYDCFVSRLNETGESLSFSTFIGSSYYEEAFDVALDEKGSVYITGLTMANSFPTTAGAVDTSYNGAQDFIVCRLDDNGTKLGASTMLGGGSNEIGYGIDVDSVGRVYVTGWTESSTFPTTSDAYDTSHNGANDVVVCVLSNDMKALEYSTFIGSTGDDWGLGLCVLSGPRIFVLAQTGSTGFPTTTGAYDTSHNGAYDLAVLELAPAINPFLEDLSFESATTGDTFTFEVNVTDKVDTSDVWAEYWYGTASQHTSADLTKVSGTLTEGVWRLNITVPAHSLDALHYRLWASDVSNFLNGTDVVDVAVTDNDLPEMEELTTGIPTTGDNFAIRVNVTDNIAVRSVDLSYYFGSSQPVEVAMDPLNVTSSGNGSYSCVIQVPANSTMPLWYLVSVLDGVGNRNSSAVRGIEVVDNDLPLFLEENSDMYALTGDPYTFRVTVADNIGIAQVRVVYTIPGMPGNASILSPLSVDSGGNGTYHAVIDLPSDITGMMNYSFTAMDARDNVNASGAYGYEIIDNDVPVILADLSDKSGTTGDTFVFRLEVVDNIAVDAVQVMYWFEGQVLPGNGFMTLTSTPNVFEYAGLSIPSNMTLPLWYFFGAWDQMDNIEWTQETSAVVRDNDAPSFGADGTDEGCMKGLYMTISIGVTDNIGVKGVHLVLWYGAGERFNITMSDGDPHSYMITVPRYPVGDLHYLFVAVDEEGNWNSTVENTRHPVNLPPVIAYDEVWNVPEGVRSLLDLSPFISDGNDNVGSLVFDYEGRESLDEGPFTIVVLYPEWVEDHEIWVTLSDGETTSYGKVSVHVVNVNEAPLITSTPPRLAVVGQTYTYEVHVIDADPMDTITFELRSPPAGMTVSEVGVIVWTPTRSQHDWHWILLNVTDGTVSVEQRWPIFVRVSAVEPGNRPPVPSAEPPHGAVKGQHFSWQWTLTDADGDTLRFHIVDGPSGAVIDNETGLLEWAVPSAFSDFVTFHLNVTDGVNIVPLEFTMRVRPTANQPPAIAGIIPDVKTKKEFSLDLMSFATDPDDPTSNLTWRIEGGDSYLFTVSIENGSLVIVPVKGAKGNATLTLFLEDPSGDFDSQDMDVRVEPPKGGDSPGFPAWVLALALASVAIIEVIVRARKSGG